jgi:hypothetical protein
MKLALCSLLALVVACSSSEGGDTLRGGEHRASFMTL